MRPDNRRTRACARAAVEALSVLGRAAEFLGEPLPLAWSTHFTGAGVIEVYPVAWLRAHGLRHRMYKRRDQRAAREEILDALEAVAAIELPAAVKSAAGDKPDLLDGVVCALCAHDFLAGLCVAPPVGEDLSREGWAWVPDPRLVGTSGDLPANPP